MLRIAGDGQPHTLAEAVDRLSIEFSLTDDDRAQLLRSGQTRVYNRVELADVRLLKFSVEHAPKALELLSDGLNNFIDAAMARVRRVVSLQDHAPEAVAYISNAVGRELPQPEQGSVAQEAHDDESDEDDEETKLPRVRGRAPIFEHGQRSIASLMSDIEREVIALPDLQRPFVWEDTKVRDLLDSLFLGFPVGTLVLWHTTVDKDARALGAVRPGLRATTLVIDGQQRLTSLFAVMRGIDVVDKDGELRKITIAFRPRDGRFEVADAAIRQDRLLRANVACNDVLAMVEGSRASS